MSINIVRTDSSDPFKVKLPLGIHIVGKDKLDCFDPRVNKNHAQLDLLNDKIIIKPLTKKPCFVKKTGTVDHETVHSGSTVTLNVGDQFGLLPDCYWYEFIPLNDEIDASATIIDTMENNVNSLTTTENYSLTTTVKIEQPDSPTSSADEDIELSADTSLLKRRLESRDNHVTDVVKKIKKEVDTDNVQASEGNVERHQKPDSTVTVFVKSEFGVDCETGNPVDHHFDLPPIVHSTESREEMQNRTEIKMESRTRTSSEQFSMLLEFMERHGDLTKPQPVIRRRIIIDQMWQELTDALNSIGSGVPKTAEKWKKVWADWKTKTKKKAITIRRGGSRVSLTASEDRLLGVMGVRSVGVRHVDIEEQGSDRSTQSTVPSESSSTDNANEHGSPQGLLRVIATPEPSMAAPSVSTSVTNQQSEAPTDSPTNQHADSPSPSNTSRRHHLRTRRRMQILNNSVTREFTALERRRLHLEEMREENESRRIDAYVERNNVLCRLADIAQTWLDHYTTRENAQN